MKAASCPPVAVGSVIGNAVPSIRALLRELEAEGIDPSSELGERSIRLWLGAPTGRRCRCGAAMARYEWLNGKCWRCAHDQVLRLDDERREQRVRFAK